MRGPSDLNINPNPCGRDPQAALKRVLQNIQNVLKAMANGEGTILRCKFTEELRHGGSAGVDVQRFDETGFSQQRSGVVYDEDNIWVAFSGDNGWCTARDHSQDNYSLLLVTGDGHQGMLERLIQAILEKAADGDTSSLNLLISLLTKIFEQINNTIINTLIQELINAGGNYLPPGGIWDLQGTLSGTLIYQGSQTMAVTGSAQTLPVYDSLLNSGQSLSSGSKVWVEWNVVHRRYEVSSASCV